MGLGSTIVGVVLLLFSGLTLFGSAAGVKRYLDFKRLSVTAGSDVTDGQLVGLKGVVDDTNGLQSPLTGTDCVAFNWKMEEYSSAGSDRGREWDGRVTEGDVQRFVLETEDGTTVTVDPPDDLSPRAQFEFSEYDEVFRVPAGQTPPRPVQRLIDAGIIDENDESLGEELDKEFDYGDADLGTRKYLERTVSDGETIRVYGVAETAGNSVRVTDSGLFVVGDQSVDAIQGENVVMSVVLLLAGLTLLLFAAGLLT